MAIETTQPTKVQPSSRLMTRTDPMFGTFQPHRRDCRTRRLRRGRWAEVDEQLLHRGGQRQEVLHRLVAVLLVTAEVSSHNADRARPMLGIDHRDSTGADSDVVDVRAR
jgi:hypothetical protein